MSAASFPVERVPKEAVLSGAIWRAAAAPAIDIPSVLEAGPHRFTHRGCTAIALALEHAGIGPGDEVLLPAYHCIAMVEPVVWRGATARFYRVGPDTTIDPDDLRASIGPATRAVLVPHYFGFPQDAPALAALCRERGVLLIEDCAHTFFGRIAGKPVGSFGDYAIASPWKFFPTIDGGVLASAHRDLSSIAFDGPGAGFDAKILVNSFERALAFHRLGAARYVLGPLLHAKDALLGRLKGSDATRAAADASVAGGETPAGTAPVFEAARAHWRMTATSRLIVRWSSRTGLIERRRRNYATLAGLLAGLPGIAPLFPRLPDDVVPQVVPMRMADPEAVFPVLKRAGVPIIRFGEFLWPTMDAGGFPDTVDLSRRIFQFPCHQDLADDEIRWIAAEVARALVR